MIFIGHEHAEKSEVIEGLQAGGKGPNLALVPAAAPVTGIATPARQGTPRVGNTVSSIASSPVCGIGTSKPSKLSYAETARGWSSARPSSSRAPVTPGSLSSNKSQTRWSSSGGYSGAAPPANSAATQGGGSFRGNSPGKSNAVGHGGRSAVAVGGAKKIKDEVEMKIKTWTPTVKLRKTLPEGWEKEGGGASGGDAEITFKLWDFGGKEEFHSVHGLFFSG